MAIIEPSQQITYFDFRKALSPNRLKGIWRMMTGYKLAYAGATTALAISALARTSTYILLGYFTDKILAAGVTDPSNVFRNRLLLVALGFVLLACVEGLFSYISGRLAAFTAEGITRRLRNYLFDHLQRLTFTYHAKTPTGDQIERVTSDVDALRRFYSEQAIGVGRIILLFVINFLAIMTLNSTLAWASVIVIPFILVVSLWFFKKVTAAYEKYQEQEATLSTTLQENLTGVRVVKAFARQDFEKNKFEKDNFEKYLKREEAPLNAFAFLALVRYRPWFPNAIWLPAGSHDGHQRGNNGRHLCHLHRTCCLAYLADKKSWAAYCVSFNWHGFIRAHHGHR